MAQRPDKKNTAKAIIVDHLRELYEKRMRGEPLTQSELESIKHQSSLTDYVFTQDKVKITETSIGHQKRTSSKNPYEMSKDNVKKAIKELLDDRIIEKKDGLLQYVPTVEEHSKIHPILKLAPDITVVPLNVTDLAFFRVPAEYADNIARYLNAQFYCDDIYSTPIGEVIMCMDLQIPTNSNAVKKKQTLDHRVRQALSPFNMQKTTQFDEDQGYTAEQLRRAEEQYAAKQAQAAYKAEIELGASYGGKSPHRIRNIKKRNSPKSTGEN